MHITNFCTYFPEWLQITESIFAIIGVLSILWWILKWFTPLGGKCQPD